MKIVYNIFREDMLLTCSGCYRFTTTACEGFKTFSEYFREKFGAEGAYQVLNSGKIWPAKARTVNLDEVLNMLRSKDDTLFQEWQWLWQQGAFHFLDGKSTAGNRVSYNTFPRCGNSFVRRVVEQTSGIVTGSLKGVHSGTIL